jgi:hypothetical protein
MFARHAAGKNRCLAIPLVLGGENPTTIIRFDPAGLNEKSKTLTLPDPAGRPLAGSADGCLDA